MSSPSVDFLAAETVRPPADGDVVRTQQSRHHRSQSCQIPGTTSRRWWPSTRRSVSIVCREVGQYMTLERIEQKLE